MQGRFSHLIFVELKEFRMSLGLRMDFDSESFQVIPVVYIPLFRIRHYGKLEAEWKSLKGQLIELNETKKSLC